MSETFEPDHITRRLVAALDALPVPEEPTGFAAMARPSLARDPRMLLVVGLLLVLVTTLASPQFQRAAADLGKYIERIVLGQGWVGYYLDSAGLSANGRPTYRLLVASSGSQPRPTTPEIAGEFPWHGQWSPDRERIAVSNDNRMYVGDRSGRLRPIGDVGAGYVVVQSGWIGNDKAWAFALPLQNFAAAGPNPPGPPVFLTVELDTGALDRRVLDNMRGDAFSSGSISPDGRWLPLVRPGVNDGGCRNFAAIYDLATRETVDVVDGNGRLASLSFGFLSDGRIVVAQCDYVAHTVELYVGAPGTRPSLIAVVPITLRYPLIASGNGNDEILVIGSAPDAPQSAYVFDPTGRLLRMVPLPQFAAQGTIDVFGDLSHDGKSLGFVVNEPRREPFAQFVERAGVVDLVTGQVIRLCDSGCAWVLMR